jgi:23S rRNA (uridine2479-2'-O)-methyltransferase
LTLILDRPGNPGNLGSILRSCDAFGVRRVGLIGHAVDPFDPVAIRASTGAFFTTQIFTFDSQHTLSQWFASIRARHGNLQIIGTSARGTTTIQSVTASPPCVLLIGNETLGLSAWLKAQCDTLLAIPMHGVASSLNVACATSIFLYELTRQLG